MKSLIALGFVICFLVLSAGCSSEATNPAAATPPPAPTQQGDDIKKAIESGKLDPATYGKEK